MDFLGLVQPPGDVATDFLGLAPPPGDVATDFLTDRDPLET